MRIIRIGTEQQQPLHNLCGKNIYELAESEFGEYELAEYGLGEFERIIRYRY